MSGIEIIALGASLAGGAMSAKGQMDAGKVQHQMASYEAESLRARGIAEAASSQRKAELALKQGEYLKSKQIAAFAASGGGTGGSAADVVAETDRQAANNSRVAVWEGGEAMRGRFADAATKDVAGAAAERGGRISAIATGLSTIGQIAMRMPRTASMQGYSFDGGDGWQTTVKPEKNYGTYYG